MSDLVSVFCVLVIMLSSLQWSSHETLEFRSSKYLDLNPFMLLVYYVILSKLYSLSQALSLTVK